MRVGATNGGANRMSVDLPLKHVSIPPDGGPDRPPAVVVMHGRGANEQDLVPLADHLPEYLHVLSVRAPDRLGPGYTWYDLDLSGGGLHASQPDAKGFDRSLGLIAAFLDQAIEAYELDPGGIGLLGFSQGAILGLGALIERPDATAWVVALHGYLPARYEAEDLSAVAGTPVFIGAGSQDQVIPASRGEEAAQRLSNAGAEVTFRTYPVGHGTAREEVADVSAWVDDRAGGSRDSDAV